MEETKKLYFGTNTKMYKTIADTTKFIEELVEATHDISPEQARLFVIPSFTALAEAQKKLNDSNIMLGAQNMCWEDEGEYTGEISPVMLKEIGIDIVEIGHSERRHVFGETDYQVKKKVEVAIRHGMTALLCIGETKEQKDCNIQDEILSIQLKTALSSIKSTDADKLLWIAYEPVWAIGVNGTPISKSYATKRHKHIRSVLVDILGEETGCSIPVLYGGSVNMDNARILLSDPNINGLFVGRSAWEAKNFNKMLRHILEI